MTATMTALPPVHMAYVGGDAETSLRDVRTIIENAITHQPRSLQKRIGPSELGQPCDHCLAAKLAGWDKTDSSVPWLPAIGTAVHALLSEFIITHENQRNAAHTTGIRFLSEQTVTVGHIGDMAITGSTDLLDLEVGTVIDFKIVGAKTLRAARTGPSEIYRVQADLYAKGWNDAGIRVDHVAIAYLPRNNVTLDDAIWWTAPHDRARAEAALARANHLNTQLDVLAPLGDHIQAQWIAGLPRADGCYDCRRYPDAPTTVPPGHPDPRAAFADLLG